MSPLQTICAWLRMAVQAWGASPVPKEERNHVDETRQRIAEDMAEVAYDAEEPPLYSGPYARAHTAILLTSIAALESRFIERIIRGNCRMDECDHKTAVGLMQVHPGQYGIRFVGTQAIRCQFSNGFGCWDANDLAHDEALQIRVGLHLLRTQGLAGFTGEGKLEGPVSFARRHQADEWMIKHPPPVADSDVMAEKVAER